MGLHGKSEDFGELVRMCTISCAPNLNPYALNTGSIRAQCARYARVNACADSSEKSVKNFRLIKIVPRTVPLQTGLRPVPTMCVFLHF